MLETSRGAQRADSLRRLNAPRRIAVQPDAEGTPQRVRLGGRHRGRVLCVERVAERYRTDDRWWTAEPVSREYFELALEGDQSLTVFHDRIDGGWYEQREQHA